MARRICSPRRSSSPRPSAPGTAQGLERARAEGRRQATERAARIAEALGQPDVAREIRGSGRRDAGGQNSTGAQSSY